MKKERLTKAQEKRIGLLKLIWINVGLLGLLVFAGCSMCGKGCGQIPECGSAEMEDGSISYVSIPLCGGCLTSERGCSTCLWGERYLISKIEVDAEGEEGEEDVEGCILSCSELYYGSNGCSGILGCFGCSGCLKCGSVAQSVYTGCYVEDCKNCATYWGSTRSENEFSAGCSKGCIKVNKSHDAKLGGMAEALEFEADNYSKED